MEAIPTPINPEDGEGSVISFNTSCTSVGVLTNGDRVIHDAATAVVGMINGEIIDSNMPSAY